MTYQRINKALGDLLDAGAGRPAVVIGGAPSAPDDLKATPYDPEAIYFSANAHGCMLCKCDYIVACDNIEQTLRPYDVPIIGPKRWADYRVFNHPIPNSGALACWAAWVIGCTPIVITGVELYAGNTYFHSPMAKSTGKRVSMDQHQERWGRLKLLAPGGMFRAVSGPLLNLFPKYDPDEMPAPVVAIEARRAACVGSTVLFLEDVKEFPPRVYLKGQTCEIHPNEAKDLIYARRAKRVKA